MKRRDFLYHTFAGAIAPVFLGGIGFRPMSASVLPTMTCDYTDRVLVIIYLAGANDIINSAVPLNQFSTYVNERPNIYIPQNRLITLDNALPDSQQLGLHPSLQGFKNLYDQGQLNIVQRVGYPTPNRSHFASEDIMLKGLDGTLPNDQQEDGWLGRFLKDRYPNYKGLPFGQELDPLGIILGDTPSTGFHTTEEHELAVNLSGQDPAGFYNIISSLSGEPITQFPFSEHGQMLQYISTIEKSTQVYSERISTVFNAGTNSVNANYPDRSNLADQLRTIARFLSGGSTTKVFMARKGGWDNHVGQVVTGNTHTGRHADLLKDVSESITAFQRDLQELGVADRVTTVIFSEFARKIIQNGNAGTDHGTVSSMFVIGNQVAPGVLGSNINLADKDRQGAANAEQLQHDYRSVFSSLLQDWMGASDESLLASFPKTPSNIVLDKVPLVKTGQLVSNECYFEPESPASAVVSLKLFLEGFMLEDSTMSTNLLDNELLPNEQPYGNTGYSYFGTEQVDSFPPDAVDWILLELWNQQRLVVTKRAVLLRKDGMLMDTDGNTEITFSGYYPEPVHLVVFHRSHIGVFVKDAVQPNLSTVQPFDISTSIESVVGREQLTLVDGRYALIAGDMDQNGLIDATDYSIWRDAFNMDGITYENADLDGDGGSGKNDLLLWKKNRSKIGYPEIHKLLKNK